MFKPSATVHKSPSGALKVLVCSEDASKCLDAYKQCTEAGEVAYIRKGYIDKLKKIEAEAKKPTKKTTKKPTNKKVSA